MNDFLLQFKSMFITLNRRIKILDDAYEFRHKRFNKHSVVRFTMDGEEFDFFPCKSYIGVTAVYLFDEKNHLLKLYKPNGKLVKTIYYEFIKDDNKISREGVEYYYTYSSAATADTYKDFISIVHRVTETYNDWYRHGKFIFRDFTKNMK